jgi:hypothetical protein
MGEQDEDAGTYLCTSTLKEREFGVGLLPQPTARSTTVLERKRATADMQNGWAFSPLL